MILPNYGRNIRRQKGSISQLKEFVQPAHSAARSKPPMPEKSEACVMVIRIIRNNSYSCLSHPKR